MALYRHVDDKNALLDGLVSTAVLGFAAGEAAGRFRQHEQSVIDADFAELLRWLRLALEVPGAVPGPLTSPGPVPVAGY